MPLLLLIAGILCCVCALLLIKERRAHKQFSGLPSFPCLPFIGNIHLLPGGGRTLFQLIEKIGDVCDRLNSPFIFWLGSYPILLTQDVDDIKTINTSFIEKPYLYNFGKMWLGDGLVTASAEIWKQNIKKLAGTFTRSVVNGYLGVFNTQSYKLMEKLKTKVDKEPFDLVESFLAFTTLETICHTALGVQNITESVMTAEYYEAFNTHLEMIIKRGMNVFLHPDFIHQFTSNYKQSKKSAGVLYGISEKVMQTRKLVRASTKNDCGADNSDDTDAIRFKPILDMLLDLSENDPSFTETQVESEVNTFILGGQESVATILSILLLMLGCNPTVQNKLYAELKTIFGNSRRPVDKEDLAQMKYCEAVINETLRMFPPFPGIMRYADRDLKLKNYTIPKGCTCAVNLYGMGRSKRIWGPDAKVFRPERWLEDQSLGNSVGTLVFSYGRRACIGKRYAMAIIKTMVAHCVRDFEFSSKADEMQFKLDVVLRPISGHLIKLRLRDREDVGNVE